MAKRGETRPWRVRFQWTNGVKGTDTYSSRDEADAKADQIRAAGERHPDMDVTVTVEHRDAPARILHKLGSMPGRPAESSPKCGAEQPAYMVTRWDAVTCPDCLKLKPQEG